jgi:hypothetical protein
MEVLDADLEQIKNRFTLSRLPQGDCWKEEEKMNG